MLAYHPHARPAIADIIAHPWLRKGPIATSEQVHQEMFRRERVNKEKVIAQRNANMAKRREVIVCENPLEVEQAQHEEQGVEGQVHGL